MRSDAPSAQRKKSDVALREEEMLAFWNEQGIFKKSVETPAGKQPVGDFVFYDGPPFATGTPHYGHILAGTIKDAIPRFWTMNGSRVVRTWGWDCHGLPLENIIEKRLGLSTKRDIEEMGVKKFNEAAREAVLEYEDDWKHIVPRMGRFVDMEDDYKTMDATYTESVWWAFAELNRKGLVYEGFKSMHLCPRCGTTLSNFEVNQGYKDIKDIAVTVKLPLLDERNAMTDASLLVWTTTPWTLPGNMAAAVHNDIDYVKVRMKTEEKDEVVILAKARLAQLGTEEYEILEEMKGSALVGKRYEPPFDIFKEQEFKNKENAWKIYHADYVELGEEGTGAVHLAPAYGEEDMELAKRENVPLMHHVDTEGRFKDFVTHLAGQLVKPKDDEKADVSHLDADIEIVKRLKDSGRLVKKENITHSYPHCWRCDTPLLNYATTSWFVRVTDLKEKLVEENSAVKWIPEHVGVSRFGKWLDGARDWAISRQRYWGAPLPIWRRDDNNEYKIFGSRKELEEYVPKSGNTFFITRHGESVFNTQGKLNSIVGVKNPLTERGREQSKQAAAFLVPHGVDYIYYSPLERTEETAHIIAEALGVPKDRLVADNRLLEVSFGEFEEKHIDDYHAFYATGTDRLTKRPSDGETWLDVKRRVGAFLYDINSRHTNARILVVSHNGTLQMIRAAANGDTAERVGECVEENCYDVQNAEVLGLPFTPMPHNDDFELDFHRPYIDELVLCDHDGVRLTRVPDVFDCWFESGSMPYAQQHYPFEHKEEFLRSLYPAQFIAEGLDQTRGWFYSLIVLGTALFGKSPYQNVIVNGLVLAEDGKKMSKSLQNYPDPMELVGRIGADAVRFYLLSSPIVRGEDLNFSEKEALELQRKNIGRLHNVLAMYEMYAPIRDGAASLEAEQAHYGEDPISNGVNSVSSNVLDRWIQSRLNEVVRDITNGYRSYELDRATRPITDFIDDLSVWYVRRSRERLKGSDEADKKACLGTLRHVLKTLSLLMAPVMPFYAEYLFLRVRERGDAVSVHLMPWPTEDAVDASILEEMSGVRELVRQGLELRHRGGVKVRQPLQSITSLINLSPEMVQIVKDELNVKEILVVMNAQLSGSGTLVGNIDTNITPELKREGDVREFIRGIQDARKTMGLHPHDRITLILETEAAELVRGFENDIAAVVGASDIKNETLENGSNEIIVDGVAHRFAIMKQ